MTTEEFYKSLVGLTREEATRQLVNDPKGEVTYIVDENNEEIKTAYFHNRLRVATARNRSTNETIITKVYGRG